MKLTISIIISLIAFLHVYIMWFEMFVWLSKGPKMFKNFDKEFFPKTKVMAANQGLYNGFLAAGLIWSLIISNQQWSNNVALFFLSCIVIAGLYGAYSASKRILYVQTIPAATTILLIIINQ